MNTLPLTSRDYVQQVGSSKQHLVDSLENDLTELEQLEGEELLSKFNDLTNQYTELNALCLGNVDVGETVLKCIKSFFNGGKRTQYFGQTVADRLFEASKKPLVGFNPNAINTFLDNIGYIRPRLEINLAQQRWENAIDKVIKQKIQEIEFIRTPNSCGYSPIRRTCDRKPEIVGYCLWRTKEQEVYFHRGNLSKLYNKELPLDDEMVSRDGWLSFIENNYSKYYSIYRCKDLPSSCKFIDILHALRPSELPLAITGNPKIRKYDSVEGGFKILTHTSIPGRSSPGYVRLTKKSTLMPIMSQRAKEYFERNTYRYTRIVLQHPVDSDYFIAQDAGKELCKIVEDNDIMSKLILRHLDSFKELLDQVTQCHTDGVIFRDLKKENLFLGEDGQVKTSDLDTACFITDSEVNEHVGTPLLHDRLAIFEPQTYGKVGDYQALLITMLEFACDFNYNSKFRIQYFTETGSSETTEKINQWINNFVKPEYHEAIRLLVLNLGEFHSRYGDLPLGEMLIINAPAPDMGGSACYCEIL